MAAKDVTGKSEIEDPQAISCLVPRGSGHQFLVYGDSCSGTPDTNHASTLARINAAISRMKEAPEFFVFLGDEIMGLIDDEASLRTQWRYWRGTEMQQIASSGIPIFNTTGNHTVFSALSEQVFQRENAHLPQNGPADQKGLSYFIRRDDLLLIMVNTMCSGLGGEGHVETAWLEEVLKSNDGARWKLVAGHHPVFAVNGYAGAYQRTIGDEYVAPFWDLLVRHNVTAYLCSHILAFDVQAHEGVLQITTGGAGTAHLSPPEYEYHHFVQACLDDGGLRYQVIDEYGTIRERLNWPPELPPCGQWKPLLDGIPVDQFNPDRPSVVALRFRGRGFKDDLGNPQTLLAAFSNDGTWAPLWIGLVGQKSRLTARLQPQADRSPHTWLGPVLDAAAEFDFQVALHFDMGPGGILWRANDQAPWNSMDSYSAWGMERLEGCDLARLHPDANAERDSPFRGQNLRINWYAGE